MTPEWLSAYLDDELDPARRAEVESSVARDPALAAELEEVREIRSMLRRSVVEPPAGSIGRIVAVVAASPGGVVRLAERRRTPTLAALAAVMVIIASVVGGVGGTSIVPALGDLVARHEAAAAGVDPPGDDGDPMPMDDAAVMAPAMPSGYSMMGAFADSSLVHLVYVSGRGVPVSVFRQDGEADMDGLRGGTMGDGDRLWSSDVEANHVVVVDGDGYVWVFVSGEPHDEMDEMMDTMMTDLPQRSPSIVDRVRDVADTAVAPFRFWD